MAWMIPATLLQLSWTSVWKRHCKHGAMGVKTQREASSASGRRLDLVADRRQLTELSRELKAKVGRVVDHRAGAALLDGLL